MRLFLSMFVSGILKDGFCIYNTAFAHYESFCISCDKGRLKPPFKAFSIRLYNGTRNPDIIKDTFPIGLII